MAEFVDEKAAESQPKVPKETGGQTMHIKITFKEGTTASQAVAALRSIRESRLAVMDTIDVFLDTPEPEPKPKPDTITTCEGYERIPLGLGETVISVTEHDGRLVVATTKGVFMWGVDRRMVPLVFEVPSP